MRVLAIILAILLSAATTFAAEIREFDLKTIERLGNELTRVSQQPDRGATDAVRKRAVETAKAALKGRLFNIHYDHVVLNDPDGSGFLVYALGANNKPNEVVLAGHFRVSVSADGNKAERVDALSRSLNVVPKQTDGNKKTEALWIIQLVSNKPVETFIYLSNLHNSPIYVGTSDRTIWKVENGKVEIVRDKAHAPPLPKR
jgi:hypothetical protein